MLSVSDKLLLAAYALEEKGKCPFTAEDLVIDAWQLFPDTFGLAGYETGDGRRKYPDSNRVFAEVMGSKPIRKRGLLTKVGNKLYRLTEAGREHARLLSNRGGAETAEKTGLPRDIQQRLKRLITSKAVRKFDDGRPDDTSFYDACAFWGISPRSSAIEFDGQVSNLTRLLEIAGNEVKGKSVTFVHGAPAFTVNHVDKLWKVHRALLSAFRKEIDVIKKRTDERV